MSKASNPMETRPVFPLLLSMSFPVIISMLIQALYNIVDSYWVAKLGTDALAAVSLAFPLQNVIMAVSVGLGIGLSAHVSIALGRKDRKEASRVASVGSLLAAIHSILFILAGIFLSKPFLSLFTHDETVLSMANDYAAIVLCLSFGEVFQMSMEKIFQGAGKMKTTMFLMATGCIVNMILDPIMIFGLFGFPAMGIRGAALATVIGQISGMVLYVIVYLVSDIGLDISLRLARPERKIVSKIYSVAVPSSLMLALPSFLTGILNGILIGFGEVYVAILGLYLKLQTFVNMPANGVIQGMRPIIGYNYGAENLDRVKCTIRYSLILVSIISLCGTLLSILFPTQILNLFDAEASLSSEGSIALGIIGTGFILSSVAIVASGVYESLGRGKESLIIALMRQLVLLVPLAFILSRLIGPTGVWLSFPLSEAVVLVIATISLARLYRNEL